MAKTLVQMIVLGTAAVGRAFAKTIQQEYQASQAEARRRYGERREGGGGGGGDSRATAESMRLAMSVEEARQILNVSDDCTPEELKKQYEFLFKINGEKSKGGGSFYLQSKVYRAKERLDKHHVQQIKTTSEEEPPTRNPQSEKQRQT